MNRQKTLKAILLITILSFCASVILIFVYRASRIDIGLDLKGEPLEAPAFLWGGGAAPQRQPMDRIAPHFASGEAHFSFDIINERKRNPKSKGTLVQVIANPYLDQAVQTPAKSWTRTPAYQLTYSTATLHVECDATSFNLAFFKNNSSGYVQIRSGKTEQEYDLFYNGAYIYPQVYYQYVSVPPVSRENSRFHAAIPRSALSSLRFHLAPEDRQKIMRLYVATLYPRVFTSYANLFRDSWGEVILNWKPALDHGEMVIDEFSALDRGGASALLVIFLLVEGGLLAAAAMLAAGYCLVRWLLKTPPIEYDVAPFRWKQFLIFFLIPMAIWTFVWLCYYPCTAETDSQYQWDQAHTGIYWDAHPMLHAFLMHALSKVWNTPAVIVLVHMTLMSFAMALACCTLSRLRVKPFVVWGIFLVSVLSPRNATIAIYLEKDVIFSLLIFILLSVLALNVTRVSKNRNVFYYFGLGLLLTLIPLYRHNGIFISYPVLLLMPFFMKRTWRLAITFATYFIITMFIRSYLYPRITTDPYPLGYANACIYNMAAFVFEDIPLAEEEYEFFSNMENMEEKWAYNYVSGGVGFSSFNLKYAHDHQPEIIRLMQSLMRRYPLVYGVHHLRRTTYIYQAYVGQPTPFTLCSTYCDQIRNSILPNKYNIHESSFFPRIKAKFQKLLLQLNAREYGWLFMRPAITLYVSLLALGWIILRNRNYRLLIVYAPPLINTFGLFALCVAQCARYLYPMTLTAGFLVGLATIKSCRKAENDDRQSEK